MKMLKLFKESIAKNNVQSNAQHGRDTQKIKSQHLNSLYLYRLNLKMLKMSLMLNNSDCCQTSSFNNNKTQTLDLTKFKSNKIVSLSNQLVI